MKPLPLASTLAVLRECRRRIEAGEPLDTALRDSVPFIENGPRWIQGYVAALSWLPLPEGLLLSEWSERLGLRGRVEMLEAVIVGLEVEMGREAQRGFVLEEAA